MEAAAVTFAEHEVAIQQEAFDHGFEYGCDGCETQLQEVCKQIFKYMTLVYLFKDAQPPPPSPNF